MGWHWNRLARRALTEKFSIRAFEQTANRGA
jgi:hypothetical protein